MLEVIAEPKTRLSKQTDFRGLAGAEPKERLSMDCSGFSAAELYKLLLPQAESKTFTAAAPKTRLSKQADGREFSETA